MLIKNQNFQVLFSEAFHISDGWDSDQWFYNVLSKKKIIKFLTELVINKEISGIFLQVNYQELYISYLTTKFLSDNN